MGLGLGVRVRARVGVRVRVRVRAMDRVWVRGLGSGVGQAPARRAAGGR